MRSVENLPSRIRELLWVFREIAVVNAAALTLVVALLLLSTAFDVSLFAPTPAAERMPPGKFILHDGREIAVGLGEHDAVAGAYRGQIARFEGDAGYRPPRRFSLGLSGFLLLGGLSLTLCTLWFEGWGRVVTWLRPRVRDFGRGAAGAAGFAVVAVFYSFLVEALGWEVRSFIGELGRLLPVPIIVLAVVVIAPLGEELYFRGRLFSVLTAWKSEGVALVVTSLLFATLHLADPGLLPLLPAYVALGFTLGWLRQRTQGVFAPLVAHALYNGFAVVILLRTVG